MAKRSKPLVREYLENVSRMALEKYQRLIRESAKGKEGVYALYRGERLRYVGLATDLRNRLNAHLRGRHSQSWDKFSIYLTNDDEHLRELEALVIRIAAPKENRQKAKFSKADNLMRAFRRAIRDIQNKELDHLTGVEKEFVEKAGLSRRFKNKRRKAGKRPKEKKKRKREAVLSRYTNKWFKIYADYKGKRYWAKVPKDGTINFNGKIFTTPSAAGSAVTSKAIDGWHFWKFKNRKSEWVKLDELRSKKGKPATEGLSPFGHRKGTIAEKMDNLIAKGVTAEEWAAAFKNNPSAGKLRRLHAHVYFLRKRGVIITKDKNGRFKATKNR
ncbi:MAG: hypothetical protein A2V67_18315 [Deltaproteobacteria bacterium RBG_13_61_14]|nr:MAG: hypothetical protein A2V67_18315 [Deltaproteobacteria bacterium RBG_13_61_14]